MNNHNNNNIELIIKKKQESISQQHIPNNLKVFFYSLAGYKRSLDNSRMTADNIINLYLTEIQKTQFRTAKDLIYHMIDSAEGPKQPVYIQEVNRATYHRIIDEVIKKATQEPKLEANLVEGVAQRKSK